MEKYPNYVRSTARPLVFVTGNIESEPDIHSKLIRALETFQKDADNNKDTANNHLFKSVNVDFAYPEKKPPKEYLSVEGILKNNWPSKHFESIPSVLVYCVPFSVDWSMPEWSRRESACQDRFNKLKAVLGPRDVKIIIIMVKIGMGSMEKDVMDERISAFKKHAQTDSKTFAFITPTDLVMIDSNSVIKRVYKSIREFSHAYYYANIRKFKVVEKTISERYKGVLECTLLARFNFKIAFLNEFQGAINYSLRYYRQAYHALAASIETIDEEMYDQVKAVAEIAHFKLCNILFSTGATEEAFQQFKSHMVVFVKLYSAHPWRHFAWVADQYLVFCQLLDQFGIREESYPSADRSYYYHNAARYTQKREISFEKMKAEVLLRLSTNSSLSAFGIEQGESKDDMAVSHNKFRGMEILPSKFLGSPFLFLDPVLDQVYSHPEESDRFFVEYIQEKEVKVNHHVMTVEFLQLALDKMNPNYHRRRGILLALIAEEHIRDNKYELALSQLLNAVEYLRSEGWVYPAVSVLGLILKCTSFLGRPQDFVRIALSIYANGAYLYYSRHEIEELHLNLMSLFTASLQPNHASLNGDFLQLSPCIFDRSVYLTTSFVPLTKRPEYGSQSSASQSCLPSGYTVPINRENAMFSVIATYNQPAVELGQTLTVKVQVVSQFMDSMVFDEVKFHFLEEAVVKSIKRVPEATNSSNLTFKVNQKVEFVFDLEVTEESFSRFIVPDGVFCLDHVEFIWYNPEDCNNFVTFDVNAYPEVVQRVKKMPTSKPLNAKDSYLFCPSERPNFVSISKPSDILQILSPNAAEEALEGILHRVDVYCQVGKYDISEGKVYLSSDHVVSSSGTGVETDDALFWTPDLSQLAALGQEPSGKDKLDEVAFYPYSLNSSLQPSQPLLLDGVLPAHSIFVIPLFVRVRKLSKPSITVKLSVDFLPRGIMQTSLVKELTVVLEVSRPFSLQYAISPLDYRNQYLGPTNLIFANCRNLLSCIVKCEKALEKNSVTLVSSQIQLKESSAEQLSLSLQGLSLDKISTQLKVEEEYVASIPFEYKGSNQESTVVNIGHFDLRWHNTKVHPLLFNAVPTETLLKSTEQQSQDLCKCGYFATNHQFSWLLSPLRKENLSAEWQQTVSRASKLLSTASTLFTIPPVQVEQLPISASVDLPSIVNLGDEFNIIITLHNRRKSIEKTTLLVMLHEHYLISGSTSTFVELPIEAREVLTLRAVAMTAGKLAIPRLVVHWERRGSTHPVKILDTGEKDAERYSIFVKPSESDLDHLHSK